MTDTSFTSRSEFNRNVSAAEALRVGDIVESHATKDWHYGLEGEIVNIIDPAGIVLVDFGDEACGRGHDGNGNLGGSHWFCRAVDLEIIDAIDDEDDETEEDETDTQDESVSSSARAANPETTDPREAAMYLAGDMLKVAHGMPYAQTKAAVALAFMTICIAGPQNTTPAKAMADMLELILRGEKVVKSIFDNVKGNTVVGPKHH